MAFVVSVLGNSGVGKDCCSNFIKTFLEETTNLTVAKRNWASALKETTHQLYAHLGLKEEVHYDSPAGRLERNIPLPRIGLTPVEIWIKYGEFARSVYGNTWVDLVKLRSREAIVICAGTRHLNELAISDVAIRVTNSRIPKRTGLSIDDILDNVEVEYTIENEGSLEDLRIRSREIAEQIIRENFK